ncbi:ABC transporter ATP-binding protein [Niallia circulans]|uniref:ABC transporter ATP-binding protein n=1 Tax=Niallia circulans TaxID=1397 RepID=UPI0026E98B7A|nr:ABC transporter ATP-binding protein [Niallia circulans]
MSKNINKKWLIIFIFLLPFAAFENTFKAFVFKEVFDYFEAANKLPLVNLIIFTIGGYFLIMISQTLYNFTVHQIIFMKISALKQKVFKIFIYSDNLLQEKNTASYVSFLLNDLKLIQTNYYDSLLKIILNLIIFFISISAIFFLNSTMAILLIVVFIIPSLIPQLFKKRIVNQTEDWTNKNEIYTGKVKDAFTGIDTIRGYGMEKRMIDDHITYNSTVERSFATLNNWRVLSDNIVGFFGLCGFFFVNLYGIILATRGVITIGTVLAIIQLSNTIIAPALDSLEEYNKILTTKKIRDRIQNFIKSTPDIPANHQAISFKDALTCENLTYKIGDKMILSDLNLEIKKGKKILITGPSGSGKSTLLKILQKRIQNYQGTIKLDGVNFLDVDAISFYKTISMINQKPFLFDDTLRNNIILGENYSEADIINACSRAGLTEVIFDKGLDYKVGEDGKNLSGGQRQRIEIARAFLRNREILLMDEATSSLDRETAKEIEQIVLLDKELTVVSVSHHFEKENLSVYDELIVLIDGNIVEFGSFEQLMHRPHSYVHFLA